MLTCQRHLFDIPADITYLNSAYMGPMPKSIQAASHAALQLRIQPWNLQPSDFFGPGEQARSKIGQLINAPTEQICFVPNVANPLGLLERHLAKAWANGTQPRHKRKIIVLGEQFPSNVFPWHNLVALGFEIQTIAAPVIDQLANPNAANERVKQWNQALLDAIDKDTALVGVEPAHWTDGTAFDLQKIAQRCHANAAYLAIDGTQTIGIEAIDLQALKPTVYVAHPYKSMLCNYGLAFAYLDTVLLNSTPLEEHWLMRHNAQDFTRLTDYQTAYADGARRFDSSNRANSSLIMMLVASLELFEQWQQRRVAQYLHSISAAFCETMKRAGYAIADQHLRCANIIGLKPPAGVDSQQISAHLRTQKIYVSVRSGTIRISPHMYNDANDFKKLSDQLLLMTLPAALANQNQSIDRAQ
jgi:selenocysteine lyase/cysteine desulfurase